MGLGTSALVAPEVGEAGRSAQLPHPGALLARNHERPGEAGFGPRVIGSGRASSSAAARRDNDAAPPHTTAPRSAQPSPAPRLTSSAPPSSLRLPMRTGRQGKKVRRPVRRPRSPECRQALAHLRKPRSRLPALGQHPAFENRSACRPEREALLRSECKQRLRLFWTSGQLPPNCDRPQAKKSGRARLPGWTSSRARGSALLLRTRACSG